MTVADEDPVGLDRLEIIERTTGDQTPQELMPGLPDPWSDPSVGSSVAPAPTTQRQLEQVLGMDLADAISLVTRFAFRLCTGNRPDTKDLVQSVFVKLVKQIQDHRLLRVDNPQAFLFTVTRNKWIDEFRTIRKFEMSSFDDAYDLRDEATDVEGAAINKVEFDKAMDIVNELRPELRQAVQLVVLEGLSRAEAARKLGVHPNTLTYRLKAALQEVRTVGRRAPGGQL